jgi:hypothetical protein
MVGTDQPLADRLLDHPIEELTHQVVIDEPPAGSC